MYKELGSRGWQRIGNREASIDSAELMEKCSKGSDTKNLTLRLIFARGEMIYAPHASFFLFYFSFFLTNSVPDLISVCYLYVKILTYHAFQTCFFFCAVSLWTVGLLLVHTLKMIRILLADSTTSVPFALPYFSSLHCMQPFQDFIMLNFGHGFSRYLLNTYYRQRAEPHAGEAWEAERLMRQGGYCPEAACSVEETGGQRDTN